VNIIVGIESFLASIDEVLVKMNDDSDINVIVIGSGLCGKGRSDINVIVIGSGLCGKGRSVGGGIFIGDKTFEQFGMQSPVKTKNRGPISNRGKGKQRRNYES